ncbi:hypothetical protein DV737_g2628, partial [Chaetothyriales sp. CBS 132003]
MAPLDQEVSWHFRGPMHLKQFAFYTPGAVSKRDVHAHRHAFVHERKQQEVEAGKCESVEIEKRAVGDMVTATINGQVVSWVNQYSGGAVSPTTEPSQTNQKDSPPSIVTATINGQTHPSYSSPSAPSGSWVRQSYYSAVNGTAQNLVFLNNMGGAVSGMVDEAFGASLSYASANGLTAASGPTILSDVQLGDGTEVALFSGQICSGSDCGFYRPGTVAYHGFGGARKLFLLEFNMPYTGGTGFNKDMPAVWILNALIPRTLQYGAAECSCWETGCGEWDIFEILESGRSEMMATFHGDESIGESDYFVRPSWGEAMKAMVLMDGDSRGGSIVVVGGDTEFDLVLGGDRVKDMTKMDGEKMEIHLNITFPRVPCELLTLDVMDVSGEQQTGVQHGVNKVRLSDYRKGTQHLVEVAPLQLHGDDAPGFGPDYCGSCYSAPAPANAKKPGCCNTCDEVREAYAGTGWAFGRGEGVVGNFHIAPGRSFSNGNLHVHDLNNYFETPVEGGHTFTHEIHYLRFGPQLPNVVSKRWGEQHTNNPLDGHKKEAREAAYNFMYFVKVVSTSYLPLGWDEETSAQRHSSLGNLVPLGAYGAGAGNTGSIETHQYSVTSHERSLAGGSDAAEGHKERLHAHGGIPGVFFSYDISPMKVINREERPKTFVSFLSGVCAVIGGTLTVAAAIDRGLYEGKETDLLDAGKETDLLDAGKETDLLDAGKETDLLDAEDYDPIDHLNAIFSHPSTLSSVSETHAVLLQYQDDLDDEIDGLEAENARSHAECLQRMEASKAELAELFDKIDGIRERALRTEHNISEMTADIKQLDNTKKNLTLSMTALKRLQMLTTAYEQLRALVRTKQYSECAQLLQAVIQLMAHFKSYRSIDQIAALSRNVAEIQRELLEQVCEDFEITFSKDEVAQKRAMLREGCLIVDSLGHSARSRLVTWYCNTQLRPYRQIFKADQEAGSLDNIDRRYAWFRKTLKVYDDEHAAIFPQHWHVNEVLANAFAEGTRDDYQAILSRSTRAGQTLDVKLLLSCLQQTLDFEQGLEKRFNTTSRTSIDTIASGSESPVFGQPISDAFEPYLSLWVDAQDKELASLIPQYRSRPTRPADEDFSSQQVIASSTELFNFYRLSLAQCAKLSTGQSLLDLSKVFGKYLDQYSQQVLLFYISERPTGGTPSRIPTIEELVLVLNTADYCYNTCNSLEEKIKRRIDDSLREDVDLQSQADSFMGIASAAVRGLVRRVEQDLEPLWREMRNMPWSKIESCENQSPFIAALQNRISGRSGEILNMLHKAQYARAFADNLVELLASTYLATIVQCKPISESGAEQMLLDLHEIKSTLGQVLPGSPPPALFLKRVNTAFGRIEPLLKTLQVRPSPAEALVQAYLIHIADFSEANFRKVLELKGVRSKGEQNQMIELFQMHKLSPRYKDSLVDKSPMLTPLPMTGATSASAAPTAAIQNLSALGSSAAATLSTANLPANMKFDAANLGSAIIDRFSSSTPGIATPREATQSQPTAGPANHILAIDAITAAAAGQQQQGLEAGAQLNKNLKNIGNFFKRDLGGFGGLGGRFGGKAAGAASSGE